MEEIQNLNCPSRSFMSSKQEENPNPTMKKKIHQFLKSE